MAIDILSNLEGKNIKSHHPTREFCELWIDGERLSRLSDVFMDRYDKYG
jgi:hypothetical protein